MKGANNLRELEVGMGMLKVTRDPIIFSVSGIGSCVALAMRDEKTGASGLAHIVLPAHCRINDSNPAPGRYADVAVKTLLGRLLDGGSALQDITAKLVGGARALMSGGFDGLKNVKSIRKELNRNGITIMAEDVGAAFGRSAKFNTASGRLSVRRYRQLNGIVELENEIII